MIPGNISCDACKTIEQTNATAIAASAGRWKKLRRKWEDNIKIGLQAVG